MSEFVKQEYGAIVATILETPDGLLEIQKLANGKFSVIVHSRYGETDRFEDLSIEVEAKHLAAIGALASPPPGEPVHISELVERLRGPVFGTQTALDAAAALVKLHADVETWKTRAERMADMHRDMCVTAGEAIARAERAEAALAQPEAPASLAKEGLRLEFQRIRDALANGLADEAFETADRAMHALAAGLAG